MSEQKDQESREEIKYLNQISAPEQLKRQLTVENLLSPEDRKRLAQIVIRQMEYY